MNCRFCETVEMLERRIEELEKRLKGAITDNDLMEE